MSLHRYPTRTLWIDYCRAGGGLVATAAPLALLDVAPPLALLLAVLGLLFAWFAGATWLRQASWLELTPAGLTRHGPRPQTLGWHELGELRLAFYGVGRQRAEGWLQLTLRARNGGRLRIDSSIGGFAEIAAAALAAAARNGLALDPVTSANLQHGSLHRADAGAA